MGTEYPGGPITFLTVIGVGSGDGAAVAVGAGVAGLGVGVAVESDPQAAKMRTVRIVAKDQ